MPYSQFELIFAYLQMQLSGVDKLDYAAIGNHLGFSKHLVAQRAYGAVKLGLIEPLPKWDMVRRDWLKLTPLGKELYSAALAREIPLYLNPVTKVSATLKVPELIYVTVNKAEYWDLCVDIRNKSAASTREDQTSPAA